MAKSLSRRIGALMKLAFVVLGMHRSGTSSLAGLLAQLGATAPKTLMSPKPENPKGFWESEVLMAFNNEILVRAQSSWDDSLPLDNSVFEGEQGEDLRQRAAQKLTEEFGDAQTIVLKDPRICRFYPFWRQVLEAQGYTPFPILIVRPPQEVAASLHGRNGMPIAEGLALWRRHVEDAEVTSREQPRKIILWKDLLNNWQATLAGIETKLGRPVSHPDENSLAKADGFLSPELSKHLGQILPQPDTESLALYEQMVRLAQT